VLKIDDEKSSKLFVKLVRTFCRRPLLRTIVSRSPRFLRLPLAQEASCLPSPDQGHRHKGRFARRPVVRSARGKIGGEGAAAPRDISRRRRWRGRRRERERLLFHEALRDIWPACHGLFTLGLAWPERHTKLAEVTVIKKKCGSEFIRNLQVLARS
jgi:hypothetical protein